MESKQKLKNLSEEQEKHLEKELEVLAEKGKQVGTNILFIIGGVALSYLVFKSLFENNTPKKKKKITKTEELEGEYVEESTSMFSQIGNALAKEATVFLLALAKEKLMDHLNSSNESTERNQIEKKGQ